MTLKEIRHKMGYTQREFASVIGVSERTYIRYENKGAPLTAIKLVTELFRQHMGQPARQI